MKKTPRTNLYLARVFTLTEFLASSIDNDEDKGSIKNWIQKHLIDLKVKQEDFATEQAFWEATQRFIHHLLQEGEIDKIFTLSQIISSLHNQDIIKEELSTFVTILHDKELDIEDKQKLAPVLKSLEHTILDSTDTQIIAHLNEAKEILGDFTVVEEQT